MVVNGGSAICSPVTSGSFEEPIRYQLRIGCPMGE
jgi:hypothetical protein